MPSPISIKGWFTAPERELLIWCTAPQRESSGSAPSCFFIGHDFFSGFSSGLSDFSLRFLASLQYYSLKPSSSMLSQGSANRSIAIVLGRSLNGRRIPFPEYIADAWINEVKWLGITISPSYVGEPQCNGVAERFMRTLKEQCLYLCWRT